MVIEAEETLKVIEVGETFKEREEAIEEMTEDFLEEVLEKNLEAAIEVMVQFIMGYTICKEEVLPIMQDPVFVDPVVIILEVVIEVMEI
jgi:hypothetical protein